MNKPRYIDLLICDCDGVLIDSEIIAERNVHDTLAERFPSDELERVLAGTFGLQSRDILARVEAHFGVQLPPSFYTEMRARTEVQIRSQVEVIPYVRDALMSIDLPLAVASNSRLDAVEFALDRCKLAERVDIGIFSADKVERPKPAPDVYLAAAKAAGVAPERCLAVEDSSTGVTAALTAGMRVVGFLGASHIPSEHGETLLQLGVERVFDDMRELAGIVHMLQEAPPRRRD